MSQNITFAIQFYSPWHCGSGLSAGADVDELVIKDKNGMPFVPGKTIKGLMREAAENYLVYTREEKLMPLIATTFGTQATDNETGKKGCMYFSNAVLDKKEYEAIVGNNAQKYMYDKVTTTAISEEGTAKDFSLRSMEVTVPCILYGHIFNVPSELMETITNSFGLIKRIGQKRNRGLGRCDIKEGVNL